MEKPLWTVVVIARNEEKTLPRLVASLKEFQERGGDLVVLDTGSTDDTVAVAQSLGCFVRKYSYTMTLGLKAHVINEQFCKDGEPEIVQPNTQYFDFTAARNAAAAWAVTDWVAMPDCDEIYTALDIDEINRHLREGAQQLEYNFVFSHFPDGKPQIQFNHCKFYDRRKLVWQGIVHEVLVNTGLGDAKKVFLPESVIKLEHFQNPSTNRSQYLPGLAIDCFEHPSNDRNSHYLARELMWSGRYASALAEFNRHIAMKKWPQERAQSAVFGGDCYEKLGNDEAARAWWFNAFEMDATRRAPLMALAKYYWKKDDPAHAAAFANAALTVPLNSYYGNDMAEYTFLPHEILYWAHWRLNNKTASQEHWQCCMDFNPMNSKYLADAQFYLDLPKVSIVVPHVKNTRSAELERLLELIKTNANYPNHEVIVEEDSLEEGDNRGVAHTLARGIARSRGPLVMFLGDDCEPQQDFLIHAVLKFLDTFETPNQPGLVALNDGVWHGKLATHWLASKTLKTQLAGPGNPDGHFFPICYHHVGCDNELTAVCKQGGWYAYASRSKIVHKTAAQGNGVQEDEVSWLGWSHVHEDRATLADRSKKYGFELI